ncbi:hypothetical protein COTS27_00429 [Spirochaetota bacterium]|nr:hypothetical protein COTS27_00429 [Spirochaetota bacterium]
MKKRFYRSQSTEKPTERSTQRSTVISSLIIRRSLQSLCSVCVLSILFMISTLVGQTTSSKSAAFQASPEFEKIKKRGYIVVAMTESDQPPLFFTNVAGEFVGIDVDIAKGIAQALDVGIQFNREAVSFNDLIPIVARGDADFAISKLSRTITRNQIVTFSTPYITFHQALMFNRVQLAKIATTNPEIASFIKRFRGKLGIIANSSYINYARKNFPNATIVEFPDWDSVITAVYSGDILAAYRDELEIKKAMKLRSDANLILKTVLLSDTEDNIAIAIAWQNNHLRSLINLYLEGIPKINADNLLKRYQEIFTPAKQ